MSTAATDNRTTPDEAIAAVFPGTSEMAARCRAFEWSTTPLGPVEDWPASLRSLVAMTLESRHPMLLWWGPELIQLFNDGFLPSFGESGRDRAALGARGREHWADVWPLIGNQIEGVIADGVATWYEDALIPIERNGKLDDVWWTYGYSPVRDETGKVNGVLVVVQETTERVILERRLRASEARLVELFRHAPAFICVLRGPEHTFEMANDAYQQLIGFRDVVGQRLRDVVPEAVDQGYIDLLDRVLTTGEPFIGRELPVMLQRSPEKPREQRMLNFVYQAINEIDGTRSGVFVHGVDVTDSVRARADAEAANRTKGEFLAVMSHELRTPLNAIGGYVELLEMGIHGPVTSQQRDALARIQHSQRHLLGLINQVLNYTRVETGTVTYDIADVPVSEALASAEALVVPQVRARGLSYVIGRCDPALAARADPEKLRQILLNLLTNAIKFTEAGGEIGVSCEAREAVVAIAVRDTGIGIQADKLASVFEPFVQVDARFTRTREGVGLGLAISRDLARGMGGDLTAESEPGVGSTFTLTLPATVLNHS